MEQSGSSQKEVEDALLERLRKEREAELASLNSNNDQRSLQFHESRKHLQNFLQQGQATSKSSAITPHALSSANATSPDAPQSSAATTEEESSEAPAIVYEIRALVESRPVSSILNASMYRRQLEEIIRVSGAHAVANAARYRAQQAHRQVSEPRTSVPARETTNVTVSQPTSVLLPSTEATPVNAGEGYIPYNREQIQQEIEVLMQQGLVSQLLQSDFSETLSHLILSLPSTAARLNTGMGSVHSDDNISIISASAQAIPSSHSTSALARQVGELRVEVTELKSMIRLLMDAQLETQRCIRQEMAPLMNPPPLAGNHQPLGSTSSPSGGHFEAVRGRGNCLICMNHTAEMMVYRCGHLCMCHTCSLQLRHYEHHPKCPVCRGRITDIVRVFAEDDHSA